MSNVQIFGPTNLGKQIVSSDTEFLLLIGPVFIQIFILFAFYFAALRRLFIPPTPSNVLVLAIVIIGVPGFLLVFLWGWIRHRRMCMTHLMSAWTLALLVFVIDMVVASNLENAVPKWINIAIPVISMCIVGGIAVRKLIPFLRADERMRALMRESNADRIAQLAQLGAQALTNIQLMLEDEYTQYRLDAIECLGLMGSVGVPLLQDVARNGDSQMAANAKAVLTEAESTTYRD